MVKLNLLMAIDEKSVIYYEINKETTKEDSFLELMKNLVDEIEKKIFKITLVMDNLTSH